jgi:hypothetical protein
LSSRGSSPARSLFVDGLPTQERTGSQDLGARACAGCHASSAEGHKSNAMERAAETARECRVNYHPKVGSHFDSTDHEIRIVRAGAPSPD